METAQEDKKQKTITGSLVQRVLLSSIILLALPLLLISFLMYRHDFEERKKNNYFVLSMLADQLETTLSDSIKNNHIVLDLIDRIAGQEGIDITSDQGKEILQTAAERENVSGILFLEQTANGYLCTASSSGAFLGKDFSKIILPHLQKKTELHLFSYPLYPREEAAFILLKQTKFIGNGFLAVIVNSATFKQTITIPDLAQFPVTLSILNEAGSIIATTDPNLYQDTIAPLSSPSALPAVKDPKTIYLFREEGKDTFRFHLGHDEKMAVIHPSDFIESSLMLSVSSKVNLTPVGEYFLRVIRLSFLAIIIGFVFTLWIASRLSHPLTQITQILDKVSQGDLSAQFKNDPLGFELNLLGERINVMITSIRHYIQTIRKEKSEKEALTRELQLGQQIQMSLLPRHLYALTHLTIGTGYVSAKEVGGDFYDVITLDKDSSQYLIVIADAAGKGVFACLYSLALRSIVRSFASNYHDLASLVMQVNKMFLSDTAESGAFVTAWFGVYDAKKGELTYTNMGHFPAYYIEKNGQARELTTKGIAFGAIELESVEVETIKVEQLSYLTMYTDGIVEAFNKEGGMFGKKRLYEIIQRSIHLSPSELSTAIMHEIAEFTKGAAQADDITLLVARFE